MRKLIHAFHGMFKHDQRFDGERSFALTSCIGGSFAHRVRDSLCSFTDDLDRPDNSEDRFLVLEELPAR